jgi:hypothetical protein
MTLGASGCCGGACNHPEGRVFRSGLNGVDRWKAEKLMMLRCSGQPFGGTPAGR